jgi:hypothetical protein
VKVLASESSALISTKHEARTVNERARIRSDLFMADRLLALDRIFRFSKTHLLFFEEKMVSRK